MQKRKRCVWDEWRGTFDGTPTMLIKRIASLFGCRVDIHCFVGDDMLNCFHSHPAWAIRISLVNGYIEEVEGKGMRVFRAGDIGIVRPSLSHRIAYRLNNRDAYSLWIRGPKCASIKLTGTGWATNDK